MIVCIDTNVLSGMFGRAAPWLKLRHGLLERRFIWALATEILVEYGEIVAREMSSRAVERLIRFIEFVGQTRGVIRHVSPSFRFHLITSDADDDKFADCAIAAGADLIITEDHHFDLMRGSGYKPESILPAESIRVHWSEV
jgi:putative PIN family toxin of toxin-antitoxin system